MKSLDTKCKVSTYERKLLQELCQILDPLEHATLLVQKEVNESASLTIPVTLGIKHQLRQISAIHINKMIQSHIHSWNPGYLHLKRMRHLLLQLFWIQDLK